MYSERISWSKVWRLVRIPTNVLVISQVGVGRAGWGGRDWGRRVWDSWPACSAVHGARVRLFLWLSEPYTLRPRP